MFSARWNSFVEFAQEVEFPASPAPAAVPAAAASAAPGAPAVAAEAGTVELPKPVPKRKPGQSLVKPRETPRPTEKTENETEMQVLESERDHAEKCWFKYV